MPNEGSENIFCILSSIADGKELREGDMVEYETEYDDHKGVPAHVKVSTPMYVYLLQGAEAAEK